MTRAELNQIWAQAKKGKKPMKVPKYDEYVDEDKIMLRALERANDKAEAVLMDIDSSIENIYYATYIISTVQQFIAQIKGNWIAQINLIKQYNEQLKK